MRFSMNVLFRPSNALRSVPETLIDRARNLFVAVEAIGEDAAEGMTGDSHGGGENYQATSAATSKTPKLETSRLPPSKVAMRSFRTDSLPQALKAEDGRDLSASEIQVLKEKEVTDCALTFSTFAFAETMPVELARLSPDVKPLRVWTTILTICVLQRMKVSWLFGDGELCPVTERTIVDGAREWLDRHAVAHPELAPLLEGKQGKALRKEATTIVLAWQRTWLYRIKLLRQEDVLRAHLAREHAERAGRSIVLAVQVQHDTMASFLAPAGRWRRWQGFMIVVTLVICTLCMNIWMYQLKSSNCCSALRLILDSGPDGGACPPVGPCRGFVGNCADITAQFADLPVLPSYPDGLADFECHAFPDDARFGDTILVGLLSCGVALPVTIFIFTCFDLANDNEPPDSYLRWPLAWPMLVWGLNAHRRWHYTKKEPPARFVKWFCRFRADPIPAIMLQVVIGIWCSITCAETPWNKEAREAEEEEAEESESTKVLHKETLVERMSLLAGTHHHHHHHHHHAAEEEEAVVHETHTSVEALVTADPGKYVKEVAEETAVVHETHTSVEALVAADLGEDEKEASEEEEALEEARASVAFKRLMNQVGVGSVYICWVCVPLH